MSKKRWQGRVYVGRDEEGQQIFEWVGRFDTRRERDDAVAEARVRLKRGGSPYLPTVDEYVERYLTEYERTHKASSLATQKVKLNRFSKDFAGRSLDIGRAELKDWLNAEGRYEGKAPVSVSHIPGIVALYNFAIDEDDLPLERNPARKLSKRSKGRSEEDPPTEAEFQSLLDACSALGDDYADQMRSLLRFAAYSLMRPGEMYPLEWTDIDFEGMRIGKNRRLYQGKLDEPKTGPVVIALTPPARDAIMGLRRTDHLVFHSKTGKRLSQTAISGYWSLVCARADLEFDFYHATKHYGVHYMWAKLGMSKRAIAAQAGWKLSTVEKMLAIYGHAEVGALEEVDAAFANGPTQLRGIEGGKQ